MSPPEDLAAWIEAVDRLDTSHAPTPDEMKAVGRDLGLSDELITHARQEAERLRVRGTRFLDSGLPQEAVEVLEAARTLEPWALDGLEQLGRAHLEVYQQTGSDAARTAAETVARTLIDALPDGTAGYALLKGLKSRRTRVPPGLVWGALGLVVGGLAVALLSPRTFATAEGVRSAEPVVAPGGSAVSGPRVGDLPVEINRGNLPDGVELVVTDVELTANVVTSGWFVRVKLQATNTVPVVVDNLVVDAQFRNSEGGLVVAHDLSLLDTHDPALYQGDRRGGEILVQSSASAGRPAGLVLTVTRAKSQPGSRGEGTPIAVEWTEAAPSGVSLDFALREGGTCRPFGFGERTHCSGVYTVTNTGTLPVETLKLRATFGESGQHDETWAMSSSQPPLRPGERQAFRFVHFVDGTPPVGPWTLSVVRLDTL